MSYYNPIVHRDSNGDVKRVRANSKPVQGGRKKHGSHRSHIIGGVKFTPSKVTELHQPGVIWQ